MRLYHKLFIGPASAILFFLLFGSVTIFAMWMEKSALVDIYENRLSHFSVSTQAAQKLAMVHSSVYRLLSVISTYDKKLVHEMSQEQQDSIEGIITELNEAYPANNTLSLQSKDLLDPVISSLSKYKTDVAEAVNVASTDSKRGMAQMHKMADYTYDTLIVNLTNLVAHESSQAKASYNDAIATFNQSLYIAVIVLLAACVVTMLISAYMGRLILRPLMQAVRIAKQVAGGDLTSRVEVYSKDETGQLSQSLKEMNASLAGIVSNVRSGANSVAIAAKDITIGNDELSQRTSAQASSLEETAASLEELTTTVKQNAENSMQANQLASNACDIAVKGGRAVAQVVVTMGAITESSRKIVDIISVIEGIAYQTNLLALNAAVEAARAGEQGRGFAVVASEVRNLARRSADAAKEIKSLIDDSVSKVDNGSELVHEAGRTMSEIVGSIKKVSNIVAEIAAASNEQSAGIEQVNQAIVQMDGVTQQNAAMVEEASAAAAALEEQARKLNEAVNIFTLAESRSGANGTTADPAQSRTEIHTGNVRPLISAAHTASPSGTAQRKSIAGA
ncbi:MAG: methyl-accepting chemotaxis protein [Sulfuricaulis sp.]|uniref:methyl-accepting chemotaxis protein n=1 Tax=Sulfuricaulis sp. TaxID=2003553 RepID=UPI003C34C1C4